MSQDVSRDVAAAAERGRLRNQMVRRANRAAKPLPLLVMPPPPLGCRVVPMPPPISSGYRQPDGGWDDKWGDAI